MLHEHCGLKLSMQTASLRTAPQLKLLDTLCLPTFRDSSVGCGGLFLALDGGSGQMARPHPLEDPEFS